MGDSRQRGTHGEIPSAGDGTTNYPRSKASSEATKRPCSGRLSNSMWVDFRRVNEIAVEDVTSCNSNLCFPLIPCVLLGKGWVLASARKSLFVILKPASRKQKPSLLAAIYAPHPFASNQLQANIISEDKRTSFAHPSRRSRVRPELTEAPETGCGQGMSNMVYTTARKLTCIHPCMPYARYHRPQQGSTRDRRLISIRMTFLSCGCGYGSKGLVHMSTGGFDQ